MLTIHQMLHFRGNLKGYVALNKNLAFLKFNLYQVKLFFSMLETFLGGRLPRPRELERPMHHRMLLNTQNTWCTPAHTRLDFLLPHALLWKMFVDKNKGEEIR